jgi:tetratricopeptide (TPR) repeat protein
LLEAELKNYEPDLIHDADYFRFLAYYSFVESQNIDEAIRHFEKAIEIAENLPDKREFAESLLRFLSEQNSNLYKTYLAKFEEFL